MCEGELEGARRLSATRLDLDFMPLQLRCQYVDSDPTDVQCNGLQARQDCLHPFLMVFHLVCLCSYVSAG